MNGPTFSQESLQARQKPPAPRRKSHNYAANVKQHSQRKASITTVLWNSTRKKKKKKEREKEAHHSYEI